MLLKSALFTDASGSVGGFTIAKNAGGLYMRARVKPVNPQSARQSAVRAIWADVSRNWFELLTEAQRTEWRTFASNILRKNKLGDDIHLSGFAEYQGSNTKSISAGLSVIADGPAVFTLPGEDITFAAAVSEATQLISVTFDDTADWVNLDDAAMIIRMGIPKNDSIEFFDGPYRNTTAILGDAITAPTSPATVAVPFPVVAGQKVFVEGSILEPDGRYSDWFRGTAIVGA